MTFLAGEHDAPGKAVFVGVSCGIAPPSEFSRQRTERALFRSLFIAVRAMLTRILFADMPAEIPARKGRKSAAAARSTHPPEASGTSKTPKASDAARNGNDGMRLNRYIARAGVCSRREADDLIKRGLVKINGARVQEFFTSVLPGDTVEVNGKRISASPHAYILLNKPKDAIATKKDPRNRRTVMDLLAIPDKDKRSLFPVGRLDRDTSGVLLITNDGELAHRLMHPRYEVDKLYRVCTRAAVKPHEIDLLKKGVPLEDGPGKADEAAYVALPNRREIGLRMHEGRNRQVRRMFEALGHEIAALERVNYAGLTAKGVRIGKWRRLQPFEIRRLKRQVHMQ